VTSGAGTVNQGSVTFTVKDGTTIIGTATSGTVASGSASVSYTLPAGTAAKRSEERRVGKGGSTGNFADSGDSTHTLTVQKAATRTAATRPTATTSCRDHSGLLSRAVTSGAGTVNQGSVTFTVKDGTTIIGTATSGTVASGSASVSYTLPAGTAAK